MSEDPVHYRTITVEAEFQLLSNEILKLIARARRQGIEPTEVWLGGPEWEIFAAVTSSDAKGYHSKERTVAGLVVRRSLDEGVRVGMSFSSKR